MFCFYFSGNRSSLKTQIPQKEIQNEQYLAKNKKQQSLSVNGLDRAHITRVPNLRVYLQNAAWTLAAEYSLGGMLYPACSSSSIRAWISHVGLRHSKQVHRSLCVVVPGIVYLPFSNLSHSTVLRMYTYTFGTGYIDWELYLATPLAKSKPSLVRSRRTNIRRFRLSNVSVFTIEVCINRHVWRRRFGHFKNRGFQAHRIQLQWSMSGWSLHGTPTHPLVNIDSEGNDVWLRWPLWRLFSTTKKLNLNV